MTAGLAECEECGSTGVASPVPADATASATDGPTHAPPAASARPVPEPEAAAALPASLATRYRVERVLGTGGMGQVLLVQDLQLERQVALKLIRRLTPMLVEMFRQEARVLASLEHENVVRLYESGVADGAPFLTMEYVRGQSLAQRLSAGRPLVLEAARIGREIVEGVGIAHERGIVHFDIKPANIFLDERGRARVADFGLARRVAADGSRARAPGGTPGYMAPEQARGDEVGPPADVFAIGVVLHEMLTGRRLFRPAPGEAPLAEPVPPSQVNPSVPPALDRAVLSALAPDPAARCTLPQLAAALTGWLERVQHGRRGAAAAGLPQQPYKLLESFAREDQCIFFGRESETLELAELVESQAVRSILVFGPCGIGKSSLLRAGLAAALDPARFAPHYLVCGPDPVARLEALVARFDEPAAEARMPVVVVDQLEELFTLHPQGADMSVRFFALVEKLVERARPLKLVLSFRAEFRADFFALEERLARAQRSFPLREIARAGLLDAIEGPSRLEAYGFSFAPGLPERLADDILASARRGGTTALPLAQIVCHQLLGSARAKGLAVLDLGLYESAMGGASGALERFVEERLASDDYARRRGMARQMLKLLTQSEEGRGRYAVARDEAELLDFPDRDAARQTLERLISDHLVVREETEAGTLSVRLASEVICPLIDTWQLEPDAAERASRALARAFRSWKDQGHRDEDLLAWATCRDVSAQLGALGQRSSAELDFVARSRARLRRAFARSALIALAVLASVSGLSWAAFLREGAVLVESVPPGAEVRQGGRTLGVTPLRWPARPGSYDLELVKARHVTTPFTVRIPAGGETAARPVMMFPFGLLKVDTSPPGALCRLERDGASAASVLRTPFTTEVPAGAYRMTLSSAGYLEATTGPFDVEPNSKLTARLERLRKNAGGLSVDCPFDGVEMTVKTTSGGEVMRVTLPMKTPVELLPGRYALEATREGAAPWRAQVSVARERVSTFTAWVPPVRVLREFHADGFALGWIEPVLVDLDGDRIPETIQRRTAIGPDRENFRSAAALHVVAGATGRTLWSSSDGYANDPDVAIHADGDRLPDLVVRTHDRVRALSGLTGKVIWETANIGGTTSPTVVLTGPKGEERVAVCGEAAALDARTGTAAWKRDIIALHATPLGDVDRDGWTDVLFDSPGKENEPALFALSGATGAALWTAPGGTDLVRAIPGSRAILLVRRGRAARLVRLDPATGRTLWETEGSYEAPGRWLVADLDADGVAEVVVRERGAGMKALAGATGRVLWAVRDGTWDPSPLASADVDGDGRRDVLASGDAGVVAFSGPNGRRIWSSPRGSRDAAFHGDLAVVADADRLSGLRASTGEQLWTYPLVPQLGLGALTFADVDADGSPELLVSSRVSDPRSDADSGAQVWSLQPPRPATWAALAGEQISTAPALGDLDGDGALDAVYCAWDHTVQATSGATGELLWRAVMPGELMYGAVLAELDGVRGADVAVACRDGAVHLLAGKDGRRIRRIENARPFLEQPAYGNTERAVTSVPGIGPGGGAPAGGRTAKPIPVGTGVAPALGDLDGDGRTDVVTHGDRVQAFRGGTDAELWSFEPGTGVSPPTLHDVDGDGRPDLLLACNGLAGAWSGRTGKLIWQQSHGLDRWRHVWNPAPQVADFGDGPRVVIATRQHALALDARTGAVTWKVDLNALPELTPRVIELASGLPREIAFSIVDARGAHALLVLAGADGRELRRIPLAGEAASALGMGDADADGTADLLVRTATQRVVVLSGVDGKPLVTMDTGGVTREAQDTLLGNFDRPVGAAPVVLVPRAGPRLLLTVHEGTTLVAHPLPAKRGR
jgi:outer membrane protein assembly factor BamB/predicted Ser/Thr protein kinase